MEYQNFLMYKINIVPKPNCDNVVKGLLDALEKNNLYIKKVIKKI